MVILAKDHLGSGGRFDSDLILLVLLCCNLRAFRDDTDWRITVSFCGSTLIRHHFYMILHEVITTPYSYITISFLSIFIIFAFALLCLIEFVCS